MVRFGDTSPMVPMLADCMTEPQPDLPREGGDRGLAAGAGDGRDGLRLPRIEFRRGQRQRAARIRRGDEGHADAIRRRMIAGDRHRAGCNRRIDEARAVGLGCRPARRTGRPASRCGCPRASPDTSAALAPAGRSVASSLKRSRSLMIFQSGRRGAACRSEVSREFAATTTGTSIGGNERALLASLGCRKNKALGRRQIEARLDAQQRARCGRSPCRRSAPRSSPR